MKKLRKNTFLYALACLAITLSVMATITPLWAKTGTAIQICSTLGTKNLIIDENGKEVPPAPKLKKNCTLCLVSNADAVLTPANDYVKSLVGLEKSYLFVFTNTNQYSPPKRDTNTARAPPLFS